MFALSCFHLHRRSRVIAQPYSLRISHDVEQQRLPITGDKKHGDKKSTQRHSKECKEGKQKKTFVKKVC
jgi:hypothetical protein